MKLSKMTKEDLELLSYRKIAELILQEKKEPKTTAELFKEICRLLELTEKDYEDKIADFFQTLTISKEVILLENGKWDLKSNHTIKVVIEDDDEELEDVTNEEEILDSEEETEDDYEVNIDDEEYEDNEDDLEDLTIINEEKLEE